VPLVHKEGDRVEGDFKGKGVWCPGVVTCDREVSNSTGHWGVEVRVGVGVRFSPLAPPETIFITLDICI
jgi:hypothetical protein